MREQKSLKLKSRSKSGVDLKSLCKHPLIAFLLTALCFAIMTVISRKYPFGKYTTVISDLEAQYAPYLFLLKSKLVSLGKGTFGYSFLLGAGKNFMGTFGYYLASPLNLLVLLFDPSQVNEFVLLLMGLKISFAGAFMCAFIEERAERKGTMWPVLWGIMYAFSSYTMLFLFHIMWLDGYMLLPLLLLMVERYIRSGRLGGVSVVLFFLFLSNYYIAYMAGIYSFLYLLGRMYLLGMFSNVRRCLGVVGRFILRAALVGMSLGVLLLPVGLDTIRNGDPTHSTADPSYVGFSFAGFIDRIFMGYQGDFGDVLPANKPLIFVSILVTFLCVLFFVSPVFERRLKIFYGSAFIAIYLVLCIDFLDVAWQVFDSPNWFWHRESFVFITLFLTVAYKVFEKLDSVSSSSILKSAGILWVLLLIAQSFGEMRDYGKLFIFNLCIVGIVALILIGMKKQDWHGQFADMGKILPAILAVITVYECAFLNTMQSGGVSTLSMSSGEGEKYVSDMLLLEDYAEATRLLGNGFRAEYEEHTYNGRISMSGIEQYAGVPGISLFNSNSNKVFGRFLKQFGYLTNFNYFAIDHSYSAPDADAFFSIGSLYSTDSSYTGADLVVANDELTFYSSHSVLPLAFAADEGALDFDFYSLETAVDGKDYFSFRNDWFASLFPCFDTDYFVPVDESSIEFDLVNGSDINILDYQSFAADPEEDVLVSEDDESSKVDPDDIGAEVPEDYYATQTDIYRTNPRLPLILNYDITITRPDELYLNISVPRMNSGSEVWLNGEMVAHYSSNTYYSSIVRLGAFEVGDVVRVSIMSSNDLWTYSDINFAYFDVSSFESQFALVEPSTSITACDDGYVAFDCTVDDGEFILTTIPYEDGWTAIVDGVQCEITPYQSALISLEVGPGSHSVELSFTPPGLVAGGIVSIIGILGLAAVSLLDRRRAWARAG